MISSLPNQETETDLHICSHIEPEQLPAIIQPIMNLANSDSERDMLLLSLLTVPKIQALDQRKMLLSLLPEEFESKTLVSEAAAQGISPRTATRWNEDWQQQGLVQKFKYGWYKKVG